MRQRQRFALVVRDVDGGDPQVALQPLQLEAHALAQLRIQVGKRLVQEQQARLHDQRPGERKTLLLAARQPGRLAARQLLERDHLQHSQYAFLDLALAELAPADPQRKRGVLEHRHVRPDGVRLEYHAQPAPVRRHEDAALRRVHDIAADRDFPLPRPLQAGDGAQRGGLAAAARSEQSKQLALGHFEGHLVRGTDRLAALVDILGAQSRHAQHVTRP